MSIPVIHYYQFINSAMQALDKWEYDHLKVCLDV